MSFRLVIDDRIHVIPYTALTASKHLTTIYSSNLLILNTHNLREALFKVIHKHIPGVRVNLPKLSVGDVGRGVTTRRL